MTGGAFTRILTYPALPTVPDGFVKKGMEGWLVVYERSLESQQAKEEFTVVSEDEDNTVYEITVSYPDEKGKDRISGRDTLLWLEYAGFGMEIYCKGEKINDHFYTGQQVPVSLGYFGFPEKLTVKVDALREGMEVFIEAWPGW